MVEVELPRLTGLAIRDWLVATRGGSPSDFYREFALQIEERMDREGKKLKIPSYMSIVRYFYILKELGMIHRIREGGLPRRKSLYAIVPGITRADDRWFHAQVEMYPATKWGSRRYEDAKKRGIVKKGRNPIYG